MGQPMKTVVNVREQREKLEGVILLRPWTTDPEVLRDMVARGPKRRQHPRPQAADRRKLVSIDELFEEIV